LWSAVFYALFFAFPISENENGFSAAEFFYSPRFFAARDKSSGMKHLSTLTEQNSDVTVATYKRKKKTTEKRGEYDAFI
jgi:hypothetical protein